MRILTNPFPLPKVHLVTVLKPSDGLIGISFKDAPDVNDQVEIIKISSRGPLRSTHVKAGQICLAIDGKSVSSKAQAVSYIKNSASLTVTLTVVAKSPGAFYRTVAAKASLRNPGVNFAPTRGHCLVQLSRVFPNGPLQGLCREGEVVLAVNGVPVSSREEAVQALTRSPQSSITTLYLLDVEAYHQRVIQELSTVFGPGRVTMRKKDHEYVFAANGQVRCHTKVDPESQHLYDPEQYLLVVPGDGTIGSFQTNHQFFKSKDGKLIRQFMRKFNETIDYQLRALEESVCCQVYSNLNGISDPANPPVTATFATPVYDDHSEPGTDEAHLIVAAEHDCAEATVLYCSYPQQDSYRM